MDVTLDFSWEELQFLDAAKWTLYQDVSLEIYRHLNFTHKHSTAVVSRAHLVTPGSVSVSLTFSFSVYLSVCLSSRLCFLVLRLKPIVSLMKKSALSLSCMPSSCVLSQPLNLRELLVLPTSNLPHRFKPLPALFVLLFPQ